MLPGMFCVSESDAAAIRTAFLEGGELAAALELRRRFVGLTSNADARRFVRTITAWQAPPEHLPDTDPDAMPRPR
ncbi:hypothetical protein [Teichococcus vastitatis]|uniref:Uncharacterized protein n=1 Tax=Teichococcus vastitatis TaxID=2307076 RepID=A0ABS9WA44_9PROT|nr:hypothetical protein [Pseudoroseomonas vastitatis]MCI0756107.1 hypothetical protein [Pseudoroseomonas vastitatis]